MLGNILITGGASGLGRATALAVAKAGGRPLVIDRTAPDGVPGVPGLGRSVPVQHAPGQPMPGEPVPGRFVSGQPVPGQPTPGPPGLGDPVPGQSGHGRPVRSMFVPGRPVPGEPVSGRSGYGQLGSDQPVFPDYVVADVADRDQVERAVHELAARAGGLDGVVTAAGIDVCGRLADVPADDWERVVRVNLLGTASVIRAALPYLCEAAGTVVTVASTLGIRATGDATAYCAAKFGVVGFTRALAAELAGRVGVTLLIPGGMRTNFFAGRGRQYQPGPRVRLNQPEDVAAAIIFALAQPPGCEIRELVVCPSTETSWP